MLVGPDVRARVALSVSSSLTSLSRSLAASYRLASPRPLLAQTGSCNAVPMGIIAAQTKMPSCKFVNPKNLDTIPANQDFTVQMAINNVRLAKLAPARVICLREPSELTLAVPCTHSSSRATLCVFVAFSHSPSVLTCAPLARR
jgi:hypothetical protein